MNLIDALLNKLTMYRLMLYYLIVLFAAAIVFGFLNLLAYNPIDFLFSGFYIIGVCLVTNQVFARIFNVKPNFESQFITSLILILIIGPLPLLPNLTFLTLAGFLAMASKYLLAVNRQHLFNPAAFAVVITALFLNQGASWWLGDKIMLPLIIVGGLLVVRKIDRFNLIFGFLISNSIFLLLFNRLSLQDLPSYIINPATLFFTFVMLTEPITSPANKKLRMYFGIFTGFILVIYQVFLGVFYTMELALLTANFLGRMIHFSTKYRLVLKEKKQIAANVWQFLFMPEKQITFIAGQFLEWTLPHAYADSRGYRRYFTIASSPTEKEIMLAVKIPENPSSFKKALIGLNPGDVLFATNLEGEFVLPKNTNLPYVFIAGGIGITPFRSIIKNLLDKKLPHSITLFYSVHSTDEFAFSDIFSKAEKETGLTTIYIASEKSEANWQGEVGHVDETMLTKYLKEYKKLLYYISGPQPFVLAIESMLKKMGIKRANIRKDYFPGYTSI